jgi:hypothetical protein
MLRMLNRELGVSHNLVTAASAARRR